MNWGRMLTWEFCHRRSCGRFLSWFVFITLFSTTAAFAAGKKEITFSFDRRSVFKMGKVSFNLSTGTGVEKLGRRAEELLASERDTPEQNGKKPGSHIAKRDARGLKQIGKLARQYSVEQSEGIREALRQEIVEIAAAIANNHRSPVP